MTFSLITARTFKFIALVNDKLIISTLLKPLKTVTWNFYLYVKFTLKLLQSIHIRKVLGSLLAVIVPEKFWTFSKNTNNFFFYTIYRRKTKFFFSSILSNPKKLNIFRNKAEKPLIDWEQLVYNMTCYSFTLSDRALNKIGTLGMATGYVNKRHWP